MDILALVASFGGGVFGSLIGALPAFILTGVVAVAGSAVALSSGNDILVSNIAFGSYLGPHVAFAGGVAAAAYAAKTKNKYSLNEENYIPDGTSIGLSLNSTKDHKVLIIGGIFGMIGFLINHLYSSVIGFDTDTVAMTVATSGILVRLLIGKSGIIGKCNTDEKLCKVCRGCNRTFISTKNEFIYNIFLSASLGLMVSYIAHSLRVEMGMSNDILMLFPTLCFGISATSLIFTQTGSSTPATHHITLIGALATVSSGNPLIGIIFAIISGIIGEISLNLFNSQCDSHIDPPAIAIFICTFIVNILF